MDSALKQEQLYTADYIESLPEGERAELIDGIIYDMASPSTAHQNILMELGTEINNYIKSKKGKCKVYPAPFAVYLNNDNLTYVEPDISVICDTGRLDEKGCKGAPDWIIEIISPATASYDYLVKSLTYQNAGVREYWIVNPLKNIVTVYFFEDLPAKNYSFKDKIKVNIYDDFEIDFNQLDI